jgi:hypothetical protein
VEEITNMRTQMTVERCKCDDKGKGQYHLPNCRLSILEGLPAMTSAQEESAKRVCERFNVPFVASEWPAQGFGGEYVGRLMVGCLGDIFVGIERDGYAHS